MKEVYFFSKFFCLDFKVYIFPKKDYRRLEKVFRYKRDFSHLRNLSAVDYLAKVVGIKCTTTETDLSNAYLSRESWPSSRGSRSSCEWIRVASVPELVEQVDKFRSLGEPPCLHRHHSPYYVRADKRILGYWDSRRQPSLPATLSWPTGHEPLRSEAVARNPRGL